LSNVELQPLLERLEHERIDWFEPQDRRLPEIVRTELNKHQLHALHRGRRAEGDAVVALGHPGGTCVPPKKKPRAETRG
jgi:hypothetical protein